MPAQQLRQDVFVREGIWECFLNKQEGERKRRGQRELLEGLRPMAAVFKLP